MAIDPKQNLYCLAPTVGAGFQRKYTSGPSPEFDASWMSGNEIIFVVNAEDKPRIAVQEMCQAAVGMSKELFSLLTRGHASLAKVRDDGNKSADIEAYVNDLSAVLAVAPWLVDPKNGLQAAPERARAVEKVDAPAPAVIPESPTSRATMLKAVMAAMAPEATQTMVATPPAAVLSEKAYCLAESVALGFKSKFAEGPFDKFDPEWLSGDNLVFLVNDKADIKSVLAVEDMVAHPGKMSKEMFAKLYKGNIALTAAAEKSGIKLSMGAEGGKAVLTEAQAANPNLKSLATYLGDLKTIFDAASWQFDPKLGAVTLKGNAIVTESGMTADQVISTTVAVWKTIQANREAVAEEELAVSTPVVKSPPAAAPSTEVIASVADITGKAVPSEISERIQDALLDAGSGRGALEAVADAIEEKAAVKESAKEPEPTSTAKPLDMATVAGEGAPFFLAKTIGSGYKKTFTDGPYQEFDASWLWDDQLVFRAEEGKQPRLAVEEMVKAAPCISRGLYRTLLTGLNGLTGIKESGKGNPMIEMYINDMATVMNASPYTIDEHDRVVEVEGYFKTDQELEESYEMSDSMTM